MADSDMTQENQCDTTQNIAAFTLPIALTIENVATLHAEIQKSMLAQGTTLTLDASHTETLTTPGIQLLLSLDKTITSGGGKLTIIQPKDVFIEPVRALGLAHQLEKWSAV